MSGRVKNGLKGVLDYLVTVLIILGIFQLLGVLVVTPRMVNADLLWLGGFALLRFVIAFYRTPKVENEADSQS